MTDLSANRSPPPVGLVTGASSGFGRAIAQALRDRGWAVYGTTRTTTDGSDPDGVRMLTMDVTDDAAVMRAVARILAEQGRIDAVLNNAGFGLAGALEDTSVAEVQRQFEVNFFGMHRVCRAVLPTMRTRRAGTIVFMSSLGGVVAVPFQGVYCASKFAVEAYAESLRMEVRPFGIRVAMIEPGDYATGFTANRRLASGAGPDSAYAERAARAVGRFAKDESAHGDLTPVVRRAVAVLESRHPRLHNPVAGIVQRALVTLRPVIPQAWFERLIMRTYEV